MPSISMPAAIIGSSVLSAGAGLIGGSKQQKAAQQAADTQMAMFQQTRKDLSPYMAAGQGGIAGVEALLGLPTTVGSGAPGTAGSADEKATLAKIREGLMGWNQATGKAADSGVLKLIDSGAPLATVQSALSSLRTTTTNPKNTAFLDPIIQQAQNPIMAQGPGGGGLGQGQGPMGGDMMARLAQTPGYQFALQQGLQATQSGFAAQGLGQSGAAMKGAAQYAEGLASTTYQQQLGNFFQLMGMGQNAAAGVGNLGQTAAQGAGQFSTSGAAASAGGMVGAANALGGGITGAAAMSQLGMFGGSSAGQGQFSTGGPMAYGGAQGFVPAGSWSPQGYAY